MRAPMTVGELREKLKEFDPDLIVMFHDNGPSPVRALQLSPFAFNPSGRFDSFGCFNAYCASAAHTAAEKASIETFLELSAYDDDGD